MSASTSASTWQQQQKKKAVTTRVKQPDIPGDYGGHPIPPVPRIGQEDFTDVTGKRKELPWSILLGVATLLLIAIHCVNGLNKR